MRTKGLLGLLLVTLAAVIAAVLVSTGGGAPAGEPQANAAVLPEMGKRLGDVARVTLVHGDSKTTLLRHDKEWGVEEKGGYPVDFGKLRQTLLGLAELRFVEPKTRKAEFYPRFEVEDAGQKDAKSTLVTVSDDKNALLGEIIIGKRRYDELGGGVDGIYVRKPGDAQSWLASGSLDLPGTTQAWLKRGIVDIPADQVKEAVLTQPDGAKLVIAREKAGDKAALKDAPQDTKLKSDDALSEPLGALANLDMSDVRPAAQMPFPNEGVTQAVYTSFAGLTVTATLIEKDGAHWARFSASGSGEAEKQAVSLNAKLSPWVFGLSETKAKALSTKLADVVAPPKSS